MKERKQNGAPGSPQSFLAELIGAWEGVTRTWFEPGVLADESPWRAEIRTALNGRCVTYHYEGALQEQPLQGLALLVYNAGASRFEVAWIDSFHTGDTIMFSRGAPTKAGFSVLGAYPDPEGGPDWGWRTAVELLDPDRLQVTAFNIPPAGDEARAVETIYTRTSRDASGNLLDPTLPGQGRLF